MSRRYPLSRVCPVVVARVLTTLCACALSLAAWCHIALLCVRVYRLHPPFVWVLPCVWVYVLEVGMHA